jgi:hypothetical protein
LGDYGGAKRVSMEWVVICACPCHDDDGARRHKRQTRRRAAGIQQKRAARGVRRERVLRRLQRGFAL